MNKNIGEEIKRITDEIDNQDLKNVSNEELIGYLFLVEKMKKKIEKMVNLEE